MGDSLRGVLISAQARELFPFSSLSFVDSQCVYLLSSCPYLPLHVSLYLLNFYLYRDGFLLSTILEYCMHVSSFITTYTVALFLCFGLVFSPGYLRPFWFSFVWGRGYGSYCHFSAGCIISMSE